MDSCYQNRAVIFKALGDENRWKILDILKGGEKCACVLLNKLEISQPTLSHHMKILCDARLVNGRKSPSSPNSRGTLGNMEDMLLLPLLLKNKAG